MNGLQGLYISLGTCEQPHGPALQADHINARCPAKKKKKTKLLLMENILLTS